MNGSTLLSIARARFAARPAPIAVGFELTHLCNLDCRYCDRHERLGHEMTLAEIFLALEGLHALGMREISLDGGEALAHPRVHDIVCWLDAKRITMRLNTNGVLVRRKIDVVRRMQKLKISLDGPREIHDALRGRRSFDLTLDAVSVARALEIPVEFTCTIGRHNAQAVDELLNIVQNLECKVIFQPVRPSLVLAAETRADPYVMSNDETRAVFARIEAFKRAGRPVLNHWASLRHFRFFPDERTLPCAAGWINVTLDPEGNLYHCGQINRDDKSNNVVSLGVQAAFERLVRQGCAQCWCARVVEENYAWGGRFDWMLPPLRTEKAGKPLPQSPAPEQRFDVSVAALVPRKT